MKNVLLMTLVTAAILAIAGCEQFSTTYQRVDDTEFRMLDFIYEPADAAPGDTVTFTAVFAGKPVGDLNDYIDWWISFDVMRDMLFGSATVVDSVRLETVAERIDTIFSPKTQAVAFRIPIPKDIMRRNRQIPDKWTDMLPGLMVYAIPPEFASKTKDQIIDTLESFLASGEEYNEPIDYLPQLLQFFTVPIRVTAKINEPGKMPHTIRSNQTVRYNRPIAEDAKVPGIPVNYNPIIDAVVVYKVRGSNVTNIEDKAGLDYETIILDNSWNSEIVIEKGYSYFLDALTSNEDSTLSMDGKPLRERHYVYRQFQLDKEETSGVHHSKFMSFDDMNGKITFPSDERIKTFTFWVTVKDEVLNEMNRPEASALAEVSGRFVYR